jgi:hypothetical protein
MRLVLVQLVIFFLISEHSFLAHSASVMTLEPTGGAPVKSPANELETSQSKPSQTPWQDFIYANSALPRSNSAIFQTAKSDRVNYPTRSINSNFYQNSPKPEDPQYAWDLRELASEEVKTSLKNINSDWNQWSNQADQWLVSLLGATDSVNLNNEALDLKDYTHQQQASLTTQIEHLERNDSEDPLTNQQNLEEQPLLFQLLFFLSIPHLIRLISDNVSSIIALIMAWFAIKGLFIFLRWKVKKKKKRRIRKNRSIDGVTKF